MKYKRIRFIFEGNDSDRLLAQDLLPSLLEETNIDSFAEENDEFVGYADASTFDEKLLDKALELFPLEDVTVDYTITEVQDQDWNEQWEQNGFDPIVIGDKLCIHDKYHLPEYTYLYDILIDPRMAFGSGTHDTTQMIVGHLLTLSLDDKNVLDCGCGTGILSIAALKLGASHAFCYDIDQWSVDNTLSNASQNNVSGRIEVECGDVSVLNSERHVAGYDVVMANINRNILLSDMSSFVHSMQEGGQLILSGFYTDDESLLEEKASSYGLEVLVRYVSNGWSCLVFRKKH